MWNILLLPLCYRGKPIKTQETEMLVSWLGRSGVRTQMEWFDFRDKIF